MSRTVAMVGDWTSGIGGGADWTWQRRWRLRAYVRMMQVAECNGWGVGRAQRRRTCVRALHKHMHACVCACG